MISSASENESFILYGFGTTGKLIVDQLLDKNIDLKLIIDQSKHGQSYKNIPIIRLEDVKKYQDYSDSINFNDFSNINNFNCLIGLHNHYVDIGEIYNQLSKAGFKKIYSIINSKDIGVDIDLKNGYWFNSSFSYDNYNEEIKNIFTILNDEKSKKIFNAILKYRKFGNIQDCPKPSLFDEYTPDDLSKYAQPLKLIDCGAYTGVAIEKFYSAGYEIDSFAAFEPDLNNFEKLSNKEFHAKKSICLPLGTWSSNCQLRFNNVGTMASSISHTGDTIIQCVSVDSVLKNFEPNLIKLDVEGAEIESLYGLEKTIKSFKPNLCISIYHKPSHLFEIPLLISSWNLNYKFHIRVHEFNTFGVVLYCLNDDSITHNIND